MKYKQRKNRKYGYVILFLSLFILLNACSKQKLIVPPVTNSPTGNHHPGKFVWHDLLTHDVAVVKQFYGGLFGWEFENSENDTLYTTIKLNGVAIGGIVYSDLKKDVNESQWLTYLSVPDVDAAAKYFKENGGTIHRKPWHLDDRGRVAVVTDPQGALLVLIKSSNGDPEDIEPGQNDWLWDELLTSNPDSATSFYGRLVGYDHEIINSHDEYKYTILKMDKNPRAGIIKNPWENVNPNWVPYIRVEDPGAMVKRAKDLDGQVIFGPDPNVRNGSVAIIADPAGAAIVVQKWPYKENSGE